MRRSVLYISVACPAFRVLMNAR